MTIWRACCRAVLGLVCLIFAGEANAVELFRTVPLTDDGMGSTARAAMLGATNDTFQGVAGSKINAAGRTVPVVWFVSVDPNDNMTAIGTELPLPMGAEGELVGGARFPNGDRLAVGNITILGVRWGVFWRQPAMGGWGMPQTLCQDAEQSWAARVQYSSSDNILVVAGSAFEGGRWRVVLHRVSTDDVMTVDLPAPPGSNSAALAIDCDMGNTLVGGWVTDRQSRMRPVVWMNSGQGWATFPIDLPNGTQGQVNGVVIMGSGWAVCGDVRRAGRTLGFAATAGGANPANQTLTLLQPLDGYANSSAESFYSPSSKDLSAAISAALGVLGDTTTHEGSNVAKVGLNVVGSCMNPGGHPVATGWLGGSPFAAQQLLLDPGSVAEVRGFRPGDLENTTIGQIVATPGGQPQACVFPATTTHVPDGIDGAVGNITASGGIAPYTFLWHNDDNDLRIRTERSQGMLRAVVDLEFTPLGGPSMPSSIQYHLIARAEGNHPGASGTFNVYAFNFASQTWVPAGSFQLVSADADCMGFIPPDSMGFINPQSGSIRLRIEFIADGNRPTALVVRMAQIIMAELDG